MHELLLSCYLDIRKYLRSNIIFSFNKIFNQVKEIEFIKFVS